MVVLLKGVAPRIQHSDSYSVHVHFSGRQQHCPESKAEAAAAAAAAATKLLYHCCTARTGGGSVFRVSNAFSVFKIAGRSTSERVWREKGTTPHETDFTASHRNSSLEEGQQKQRLSTGLSTVASLRSFGLVDGCRCLNSSLEGG